MTATSPTLLAIYRTLLDAAGHRGWWPGRTRLEIILGAILTQNTSWRNVEQALARMREGGLLRLEHLRDAPEEELAEAIRSSGYFRQKARKIRTFLALLDGTYGGSLTRMGKAPAGILREQLLAVWGIGPETADSILLYAFGRPVFVVDSYTGRVLARHGLVPFGSGYEEIRSFLTGHLPEDAALFNDFHAQFVWAGHHFCGTAPRCTECPLRELLPGGAPVPEPDRRRKRTDSATGSRTRAGTPQQPRSAGRKSGDGRRIRETGEQSSG